MGRQKVAIEDKICPGCGSKNPSIYSYCKNCQSAQQAFMKGGFGQYKKLEFAELKEVNQFVDSLINKRGFLDHIDAFRLLHYFQITHKMCLKYDNYSPATQLFFIFTDMLIWQHKHKGRKETFKKVKRREVYKILMYKNANQ